MMWQFTHTFGSSLMYEKPSAYRNVKPPIPRRKPTRTASTEMPLAPGFFPESGVPTVCGASLMTVGIDALRGARPAPILRRRQILGQLALRP
jgi:hypothetical protein